MRKDLAERNDHGISRRDAGAGVVPESAGDADEALQLAEAHRPDVVLMDVPGMDAITATAQLHRRLPATRLHVLTTCADDATILPALRAGALGPRTSSEVTARAGYSRSTA